MSYLSQGIIGLIIGIILALAIFGILLIIFSIIMLVYGLSEIAPGTLPGRCGTWGHDWRWNLPGLPAGKSCRNCLVRKDKAVLAWRQFVPPGLPAAFLPWAGLAVPINAAKAASRHAPTAFILLDDPRRPRIPVTPGAPFQLPPMAAFPTGQLALQPAAVGFSAPSRAPPPPKVPATTSALNTEALCTRCFTVIPPGVAICPNCQAPRA